MGRRKLDQYFTPEEAVAELLKAVPLISPHHHVFEPCAGMGNIAAPLICHGCSVLTNDVDPGMPTDMHADIALPENWVKYVNDGDVCVFDWIISNPPFSKAHEIVPLAVENARIGVAMLLRLSFLEPVEKKQPRAAFLESTPPQMMIVLPRISFTGDGKTDSVTCAWFVWLKDGMRATKPIHVVRRAR